MGFRTFTSCLCLALLTICGLGFCSNAWAEEQVLVSDLQLLVNPANPLPAYLAPDDLVATADFVRSNANVKLRATAAAALKTMLADLKAAGYTDIYANSGYRSYTRQNELYTAKVRSYTRQGYRRETAETMAARWVLPAGFSEHQTGLAVDLSTSAIGYGLTEAFGNTAAGKWLAAHCAEYGFIIRYTAEKQAITGVSPEPWHFRYVGIDHAQYMQAENLCLEEYHARLREQSPLLFETPAGEKRAVHYSMGDTSAELAGTVLSVSLARKNSGEYIITSIPLPEPLYDTLGHWGEQYIRRLYDLQVVSGYPDHSFRPDAGISRAEFITILSRLELAVWQGAGKLQLLPGPATENLPENPQAEDPLPPEGSTAEPADEEQSPDATTAEEQNPPEPPAAEDAANMDSADTETASADDGINPDEPPTEETSTTDNPAEPETPLEAPAWQSGPLPFADVDETAFYYEALQLCYRAGLLEPLYQAGQQMPLFQPSQVLLRREAALMLAALFAVDDFALPQIPSYFDLPHTAQPLAQAVEYLTAAGIFQGAGDRLFQPQQEVSRAALSAILSRLLDALAATY